MSTDDVRALQSRYLCATDGEEARRLNAEINRELARMSDALRSAMGAPTEQYERIEAMIDSFDRYGTDIDRAPSPWWRCDE